jgi:hypothetical protein
MRSFFSGKRECAGGPLTYRTTSDSAREKKERSKDHFFVRSSSVMVMVMAPPPNSKTGNRWRCINGRRLDFYSHYASAIKIRNRADSTGSQSSSSLSLSLSRSLSSKRVREWSVKPGSFLLGNKELMRWK